MLTGKIIKGVGGLYEVVVGGDGIYLCKAKGVMRNKNIKPVIGDICSLEVIDGEKKEGIIFSISERKNEIVRPRVSNVDQIAIIMSIEKPSIDLNLLDKYLVLLENKNYEILICINKTDLQQNDEACEIKNAYENIGYTVFLISALKDEGITAIKEVMEHKTTALAGPSGVGKSSISNRLLHGLIMETGEVSEKISRGRHTTRHVQLLQLNEDTFFFDTPGFSSLEFLSLSLKELEQAFIEMRPFLNHCFYRDCKHINEPDCAVKEQVGKAISLRRYDNYVRFYNEIKSKGEFLCKN